MLELYHTVNSVCAQKIRIQLDEKGLDWKSNIMTLRGDQFEEGYLKLNPNGVVPTLVHDGIPIIESSVILYYLEERFPEPSLMPDDPLARVQVRLFNKMIDEYVHNACTVLTFAIALRPRFLAMEGRARESYLSNAPDQKRAAYKRDVIAHGLDSPFVQDAVAHYDRLLRMVDREASKAGYLAGEALSLADMAVIPYLLRLDLLRLSGMWDGLGAVRAWFDRLRARPSVQRAILGSMSADDMAPFAGIAADPWPRISALQKAA